MKILAFTLLPIFPSYHLYRDEMTTLIPIWWAYRFCNLERLKSFLKSRFIFSWSSTWSRVTKIRAKFYFVVTTNKILTDLFRIIEIIASDDSGKRHRHFTHIFLDRRETKGLFYLYHEILFLIFGYILILVSTY